MEYTKNCLECKNEFTTTRSFVKYCSKKCREEVNKKRYQYFAAHRIRWEVLKRDKFHCIYCGYGPEDGAKLEVDHVFPKSKGGESIISNYVTSCKDCNIGKSDNILYEKTKIR